MQPLKIYNTLSREKEIFKPLHAPLVGLYVCGPTVYNFVHLGNLRTFTSFDILHRYLRHIGYKVRYVRNITDVGHLVGDGDEGEDKIGKMAKLEKLEPMEIVHRYTQDFHEVLATFNLLPPSIEPTATGHIVEQIETTKNLLDKGLAYESNGSIYFDIEAYNKQGGDYGKLSGRVLDDLLTETRDLDGVGEKRSPLDFALWKKASPEHIMRWPSPWGEGFPGWHLECSAMSTKYLGEAFDIHGGGMDLKFPHHESEIAQNTACCGHKPVNVWMHGNMLTVNGQKMSKSLGNSFLPHELFAGEHPLLDQGYSPMVVRFFMLQAHYRSTLDFSNEALKAAEKGYHRLMEAIAKIDKCSPGETDEFNFAEFKSNCYQAMNDDFNTPILMAQLFEVVKVINSCFDKKMSLTQSTLSDLKSLIHELVHDVLGLKEESNESANDSTDHLMQLIIQLRQKAKENKDYPTSDLIRDELKKLAIQLNDSKDGTNWTYEK